MKVICHMGHLNICGQGRGILVDPLCTISSYFQYDFIVKFNQN